MGENEGQDGEYDATYWENPNLTFPQQSLPSWADFYNAFPKNENNGYITFMNNHDVYNLVGDIDKKYYKIEASLRGISINEEYYKRVGDSFRKLRENENLFNEDVITLVPLNIPTMSNNSLF